MRLCAYRHGCVEAAEAQQNIRLVRPIGDDVRPAPRTKAAEFARRGLVGAQQLFSPQPTKRVTGYRHDARESGGMGFPAHAAMAVHERTGLSVNFVGNSLAQAASSQHRNSPQIMPKLSASDASGADLTFATPQATNLQSERQIPSSTRINILLVVV